MERPQPLPTPKNNGGRKPRSPNKIKAEFRAALRQYAVSKKVHPHFWLVDLIARPGVKLELKLRAAIELAQYIEPKLKHVEVVGDPSQPLHVMYEMLTPEERQQRITALLAKREQDAL